MSLERNNYSSLYSKRMLNSLLLLSLLVSTITAYPEGAPSTTCESMMPDHGYDAQNTTSPFFTALDLVYYNLKCVGILLYSSKIRLLYFIFKLQVEIPFDGSIILTISSVDPELNKTFTGYSFII